MGGWGGAAGPPPRPPPPTSAVSRAEGWLPPRDRPPPLGQEVPQTPRAAPPDPHPGVSPPTHTQTAPRTGTARPTQPGRRQRPAHPRTPPPKKGKRRLRAILPPPPPFGARRAAAGAGRGGGGCTQSPEWGLEAQHPLHPLLQRPHPQRGGRDPPALIRMSYEDGGGPTPVGVGGVPEHPTQEKTPNLKGEKMGLGGEGWKGGKTVMNAGGSPSPRSH